MASRNAHLQDLTVVEVWSLEKRELHINVLKMKAIQFALIIFRPSTLGESVVLMNDNTAVVAYLKKQGYSFQGDV